MAAPLISRSSKLATKVFAIPELLEMILVNLPARDILLHAQATNRTFRETISGSKQLQRLLFFEPATNTSSSKAYAGGINTLLFRDEPEISANQLRKLYTDPLSGTEQLDLTSGLDMRLSVNSSTVDAICCFRDESLCRTLLEGYRPPPQDAKWRKMLMRQPPDLPIHIKVRILGMPTRKYSFPPRTTFGTIVNWLEAQYHLAERDYHVELSSLLLDMGAVADSSKVDEPLGIIKRKKGTLAMMACYILHGMVCKLHRETFDQHKASWTGKRYTYEEQNSIWKAKRRLEENLGWTGPGEE